MDILNKFKNVRVFNEDNKPSLHKPILLLFALSQCYQNKERLISFKIIDKDFNKIFLVFSLPGKATNSHYPFGKLENDGIWEVTESKYLKRTSVGHLSKKELLAKNTYGGFIPDIYENIILDKSLIEKIINDILCDYINPNLHGEMLSFLGISTNVVNELSLINERKKSMALIGTQTFALSKWWASKTIQLVKTDRNIFSKSKMREIRKALIAGDNMIKGTHGWMQAAQLLERVKTGEYELTNFGRVLSDNDPKLEKSASWWAIHLAVCFSERGEPYHQFFIALDVLMKEWIQWKVLMVRIDSSIEDAARGSLTPNLEGVRKMFEKDNSLAELGLIETRKIRDEGLLIRLGSPKITDEIIVHALAMIRFHRYKSRSTIDFSELSKDGLEHFLCCSSEQLRQHLRRMNQSHNWKRYFSFNEAVNIDSIAFEEDCAPGKTLLLLLQQGEDTWL